MRSARPLAGKRVAIVYDCLYPYTVGGGERWFRQLAEGLRDAGADVTYLTRRQWDKAPSIPGIRVVGVSAPSELYDAAGTRKLLPTLRFGAGLGRWLIGHRREFDVVQTASFPFWSLLALRLVLFGSGTRVVVEWFELWSARFWRTYAGRFMGSVGYAVQQVCLAASPTVIVTSATNARRLAALGYGGTPLILAGLLPPQGPECETDPYEPAASPFVLFAGRHIRDKGVDLLPEVFDRALRQIPELRFVIAGDGPLRVELHAECVKRRVAHAVDVVGFVSDDELQRLLRRAACVIVPSRREGYGFMVVDAMGKGTPVVTTAFEENLAADHIDQGRNGIVARPPTPERLASGIVDVISGGPSLRATTLEWYREHAPTKAIDRSVEQMVLAYTEWVTGH